MSKATRRSVKPAQSAMEYLMTYGWAILIIAVVLGVLFQLGVFTGTNTTTTTCIAIAGFSCTNPSLSTGGVFSAYLGQVSSGPLMLTGVACTNSTTAPSSRAFTPTNPSPLTLQSEQQALFNITCFTGPVPLGSHFSGYVWIQYTQNGQSGLEQNIAALSAVATTTGAAAVSGCSGGSIIISSSESLSGSIVTNCNVIVNSGVTLTTDGYSIVSGGTFENMGTVTSGYLNNAGQPGTVNPSIVDGGANGNPGTGIGTSYGGSGGGGAGPCECGTYPQGGAGGATSAAGGSFGGGSNCNVPPAGSGSTPSYLAMLSSSTIATWYANGIQNYLSGAGGGAGGGVNGYSGDFCTGQNWYGGTGGDGAYGIYIQANTIDNAGTITAGGADGTNGAIGIGGGGGGAGTILLAYGPGGLTSGTVSSSGGSGAGMGGYNGGSGGDGNVWTYSYGATPPVSP